MSIYRFIFSCCFFLPCLTNASSAPQQTWSPYASLDGGMSSQSINQVIFQNPRSPQMAQSNHDVAVPTGALAFGTSVSSLPIRLELRGTVYGQNNFNREYYFPSLAVIGIQKIYIQSSDLMVKGYYDLPLQHITPFISGGVGASWNRTHATQYAPEFPGWTYRFVGTTQNQLAWSAGLGFSMPIVTHLMLQASLNYVALGQFDTGVLPHTGDEHIYGNLHATELLLGLRYAFS